MAAFVIGLTGGIGSGKSTVAKMFAELGVEVIDADQVARELVQPGTTALKQIADYFGSQILTAEGRLDRTQLRHLVFANEAKKQWLNNLLHPAIREEMLNRCQQAHGPYCILEVPLLVENKLVSLVNRVLVVDVDEKLQIARTLARDNNTLEQVKNIIKAQATRAERLAVADDIIDNTQTLDDVAKVVAKLHQQYLMILVDN